MTEQTRQELEKLIGRIEHYPQGFTFTIRYRDIPTQAKRNAMSYVLREAKERGFIESLSMGLSIEDITGESGMPFSEETFRRL